MAKSLEQKIATAKAKGDPTTFEEAVVFCWKWMNDEGKRAFLELGPQRCMDGLGKHIRDGLNLWARADAETALVHHMRDRFKVRHPNDISGMIMNAMYAQITLQDYDPALHAEKCRAHWLGMGINPDKDI